MSNSTSGRETLRVSCEACSKIFKVPASKAGKRGPCPNCGQTIVVPEPEPVVASDNIDWGMIDPGDGAGAGLDEDGDYGLAEPDEIPTSVRRPSPLPPAAAGAAPPAGARMTPRQIAEARAASQSSPRARGTDALPGPGRFVLGIALACVFAAVGCTIWLVLAIILGVELGILAIGVGAAIGAGMMLGYGAQTDVAGMTAGGVSLFTIFLTKAIPAAVLALGGWALGAASTAMVTPFTPTAARAELPHMLIDDLVRGDGLDYAQISAAQDDEYLARAQEQVGEMDDATLELTFKRQQVADCLELDALGTAFANFEDYEDDSDFTTIDYVAIERQVAGMDLASCDTYLANYQGASIGLGFWGWFGEFLHPLDALWVLLAVGAAWKIASGHG